MSAKSQARATARKRPAKKSPARSKPSVTAKASAAKPAATAAAKPATKPATTAASGRGPKAGKPMPRWSTEDVQLLLDTVAGSRTAKEAFAKVAEASGRSAATVQAKYYQLQKQAGRGAGRARRAGRAAAAAAPAAAGRAIGRATSAGTVDLRGLSIDALVGHAREVKAEIDRRRRELDDATRLFK